MIQKELTNIEEQVYKILQTDFKARNDDNWLIYRIWGLGSPVIPYINITGLPKAESITRMRRKIQNQDGNFLPTDETRLKRRQREKDFKLWFKAQK